MGSFAKNSTALLIIVLVLLACSSSVKAAIIGDVNNDNRVDIIDIGIVIDNYDKIPIPNPKANLNGDNRVDIIDIGIVIDNYGKNVIVPTPTGNVPTSPPGSTVPCNSLTGIEKRFPCTPISAGSMPEQPSSNNAWAMFLNTLYEGESDGDGINERFSAVANPVGSGAVIRNQNLLSDSEKHTTIGTNDDLTNGSTSCSAFRWLWKDASELPQRGWLLVWQLQMSGSPIVAVSTDESSHNWFFKSRNGSDSGLDINLAPVAYGRWAYFVVCIHLADAPNGWTKIWFRYDGWPDVNAAPFYQRSGHDTYQGSPGRNTIGIYASHDGSSTSYYGYFDRFGRAETPQRAVQIAGNP